MNTVDLDLPVDTKRFGIINDIQDRAKYELGGWSSEYDTVFAPYLERTDRDARSETQRPFRQAMAVCMHQRRDVFRALGGTWDPLDPKYDHVTDEMVTEKLNEFRAYLECLGQASYDDAALDAVNAHKLHLLRGELNRAHSNEPGIAVKLTPEGESLAFEGHAPTPLLQGTSSFYHFPQGEYSVSDKGNVTLHFGPNDSLILRPEHVFIVKSIPPQHHLHYPANFWHNPAFLPNGTVNKFFDPKYLKEVRDAGLTDMLENPENYRRSS